MKIIDSQQQLYMQLARSGDPAAFCALFRDHLNNLYISLREGDKEHGEARDMAVKKVLRVYQNFIGRRLINPQRWIAAKCGLKKFNPDNVIEINAADSLADYEKHLNAALQRCYSDRLNSGVKKGTISIGKHQLALPLGLLAAAGVIAFLFFAQSVFYVSFDRFNRELRISFPMIKEELWKRSGLVHSAIDTGALTAGSDNYPPQLETNTEPVNGHE